MSQLHIVPHQHSITLQHRIAQHGHPPAVVWFTGLSGSGKSTIANIVEQQLFAAGKHTYILDGDNIRMGLNKGLGFSEADRQENLRRIAEVARLFVDAGIVVLSAFVSPLRSDREMVKHIVGDDYFIEVFVDTPLEVCEQRDVKGLYQKARRGEIKNFTGIDAPYEAPLQPDLRIETASCSAEQSAAIVIEFLKKKFD